MNNHKLNLSNVKKGIKHPTRALDEVAMEFFPRAPIAAVNSYQTIGTNVFERDWDVLILLDTCRVDALQEVAPEYEFLGEVESIWSVGGGSAEWVARTFDENHLDEIQDTAYLAANGHVQQVLDDKRQYDKDKHFTYKTLRLMPTIDINSVGKVEYLFQYERWGEEGPRGHVEGMTPPRYVTDRAINISRNRDYSRLILHYFQPHSPWVSNALAEERDLERFEDDWWGYLTTSGDVETVWNAYLDELRYVLDDVKLLLNNLDAEQVIISADHGEAFGEYGILGHKIGSLHPKIRKVPWAVTSGEDTHTYEPTTKEPKSVQIGREELDEQLKALGYKV